MKIRKEKIDMFKSIGRINKKIGRSCLRNQLSVFAPRRFQDANGCGADGDDSLRIVNLDGSVFGNRKRFRVHPMRRDIFRMHRSKSSGTDVKRDKGVRNRGQYFLREMKTGRRCGERTRFLSKNSLITFTVC